MAQPDLFMNSVKTRSEGADYTNRAQFREWNRPERRHLLKHDCDLIREECRVYKQSSYLGSNEMKRLSKFEVRQIYFEMFENFINLKK